uniref:Uncharacterized protein n=1 Tax=viral metagenome TaxID=1070528 RepID=A0A6M3J5N9_9ZZZZ
MNYLLGIFGCWIFSDALYSYSLYKGDKNYKGNPQNWANDHWVRAVRGLIGIALMIMGGIG